MRSALVMIGSLILTVTVIGNAYYQKNQFYPSVVYITKSNPSMAIIYIQALVLVWLMGKLMRKVFFGQLRAAELEPLVDLVLLSFCSLILWRKMILSITFSKRLEFSFLGHWRTAVAVEINFTSTEIFNLHLIERSWYAVTETCLAFTVFRDDFSPKFVALFTLLLFLKCFHWLAEDRVDYMERSPVISWLFHIRVISLLTLLGALDYAFVSHAYHSTLTKGPSVQLVFGFEYAILFSIVVNILIKYILHTIDLQSENPWENKAVYLLYCELLMGSVKVILYITFMVIMIKIHTFPLFAIRPMYLSMRAFKKAVNDVIMSRRAIRNMNTLYPDATPEELATVDNVCIICREEMTGGGISKKLPCNHIFHATCLRSWFQRQQTCPTCRMDVLSASTPANTNTPNANAPPAPQEQQQQQPQQPPPIANWPGAMPFPFWLLQQQQAAITGGVNAQAASTSNTNEATGDSSRPSVVPPLPFFPFFFPPPPPAPANDLRGLSTEELQAMEGQERENVEARIQCLRNIQTLLDAAVLQMQQYSSLVASLREASAPAANVTAAAGTSSTVSHSKTTEESNSGTAVRTPEGATSFTVREILQPKDEHRRARNLNSANDDHASSEMQGEPSSPSSDLQEELRRRRLQRFTQSSNSKNSNHGDSATQIENNRHQD